jgi:hypothetical protein
MGRTKFFLSFDLGSINATTEGKDNLKGQSCKVEPECMHLRDAAAQRLVASRIVSDLCRR